MEAAGVHVAYNYDFRYVHTKVYIVDNETLIIGSINPTYSGVTSDLGLALVIQNSTVASEAAEVVLNDYRGVYPSYDFQGFAISPINSYDALSWLLGRPGRAYAAVEEIYSDSGLAGQLMGKAALAIARVTDVSGVEQVQGLTAKVIVVGSYVYVGSINLDYTSLHENREMGLILYCPSLAEAAKALIEQWAGATATTTTAATANTPPTTTAATATVVTTASAQMTTSAPSTANALSSYTPPLIAIALIALGLLAYRILHR
jgi:phosphatidylserine/phosphatidylglycerophosphate/cardiolipin synthase-like enzyme